MSQTYPRVLLMSELKNSGLPDGWRHVSRPDQLVDAGSFDALVIDVAPEKVSPLVRQLRSHESFRLALILSAAETDELLVDGVVSLSNDNVLPIWRLWKERLDSFNLGKKPERFDERVIAWLWAHPRKRIEPERSPERANIYHYPLLEAMSSDEPVNQFVWLKLMQEQNWLQPGELIDRIRLCRDCSSGHLNYVDVCPQCNALEIARQPALHCFTCGHVGAQEQFLKDGVMICPNCLARLRHIGSDYDRPLENYRCQACQSFFVDADVEARCLDCDEHHQPDDLRIREIRAFTLTERGRLRCRQGFSESGAEAHFGRLNLINPDAFRNLLDWQIQQVRRYSILPHGSLMVLRFANLQETMTQSRAMTLLDSLIDRIREAVRETDRCTRTNEEQLWLLLPSTDRDGMHVLRGRLANLIQNFHEQDDVRFDIRIAGFTLPTDLLAQEDGTLLMARLGGEVSG